MLVLRTRIEKYTACYEQRFMIRRTIIFGISGEVKLVTLSLVGRGIGGGVHENNTHCFLLRMAHLLIFIHNGGI